MSSLFWWVVVFVVEGVAACQGYSHVSSVGFVSGTRMFRLTALRAWSNHCILPSEREIVIYIHREMGYPYTIFKTFSSRTV